MWTKDFCHLLLGSISLVSVPICFLLSLANHIQKHDWCKAVQDSPRLKSERDPGKRANRGLDTGRRKKDNEPAEKSL